MSEKLTSQKLEAHLFQVADIVRKRLDPAEYRPLTMALFFIKRLSDTFDEKVEELEKTKSKKRLVKNSDIVSIFQKMQDGKNYSIHKKTMVEN